MRILIPQNCNLYIHLHAHYTTVTRYSTHHYTHKTTHNSAQCARKSYLDPQITLQFSKNTSDEANLKYQT